MQLIATRTYPFLDCSSLEERTARDCLFKAADGAFLLYMKSQNGLEADEDRLIRLDFRAALLWLNASENEYGNEWSDDFFVSSGPLGVQQPRRLIQTIALTASQCPF